MAEQMDGYQDRDSGGQKESIDDGEDDEDAENVHNDENEETISWCGSFKSCQSRLGSECSYYSFDDDGVQSDLDDDVLNVSNCDELSETNYIDSLQQDVTDLIIRATTDVMNDVCDIANEEDEEETDGKFSPIKFYNSEEDINNDTNDYEILSDEEKQKYCDSIWSDSNSLSSSGSSLAERSLDSDGSCSTSRAPVRRPPLIRRNTISTTNRKPWNYAAGSPACHKQLPWPVGTKKISLA